MRKEIPEKSRKYPADANKKFQKHEPTGNRFSPQRRTDGRSVSSIPGSCRITELSETSYTVTKKNIEKKRVRRRDYKSYSDCSTFSNTYYFIAFRDGITIWLLYTRKNIQHYLLFVWRDRPVTRDRVKTLVYVIEHSCQFI